MPNSPEEQKIRDATARLVLPQLTEKMYKDLTRWVSRHYTAKVPCPYQRERMLHTAILNAAAKYDPEKSQFNTYVRQWIRAAYTELCREEGRLLYISQACEEDEAKLEIRLAVEDRTIEKSESAIELQGFLRLLNAEEREILHYWGEGYPQSKIAKLMNIPPRTICFRIRTSIALIKRHIAHVQREKSSRKNKM